MKNIILIFLFTFAVHLYGQNSSKFEFKPKYSIILTSKTGEKMMDQCSRSTPEKVEKYFDLTGEEIVSLENNFKKILSIKSAGCCFNGWKILKLDDYGFQYIGVIVNNHKYIYINAFIVEDEDDFTSWYKNWKIAPIIVCDGGDGFWGVLFDLEKKLFLQLSVNGVG